jgi:hypothetical protein
MFKGYVMQEFLTEDAKLNQMIGKDVDVDQAVTENLPVWVCLLRGGIILLSERDGGAKLEYSTPIGREMSVTQLRDEDGNLTGEISIVGIAHARGKKVTLSSRFPGAFYVFERQLARLIVESPDPKTLAKY